MTRKRKLGIIAIALKPYRVKRKRSVPDKLLLVKSVIHAEEPSPRELERVQSMLWSTGIAGRPAGACEGDESEEDEVGSGEGDEGRDMGKGDEERDAGAVGTSNEALLGGEPRPRRCTRPSGAVLNTEASHKEDLLGQDGPDMIDILAIPATTVEVVDPDFVAAVEFHLLQQLWVSRHVEAQRLQALLAKHLGPRSVLNLVLPRSGPEPILNANWTWTEPKSGSVAVAFAEPNRRNSARSNLFESDDGIKCHQIETVERVVGTRHSTGSQVLEEI
ncbi:hypothetical protein DFH06DRAFT_1393394 [Mycena polygramma]|nr:hypothetical protein DFH06DRAFT_1393394 [Mycena polygramma]